MKPWNKIKWQAANAKKANSILDAFTVKDQQHTASDATMATLYVVVHWRDSCAVALLDDAPAWLHKWKRQRRAACEAEIVRHVTTRELTCEAYR